MPLVAVSPPDITIGDSSTIKFRFTINSGNPDPSTVVKATLTDQNATKTYSATVTCSYDAPVGQNPPIWTAVFPDTTTMLSVPSDLGSKLDSALAKAIDASTGYAIALLEIQIGSPYNIATRKFKISVGVPLSGKLAPG